MIAMAAMVVGDVLGGRKISKQNKVSIHRKLASKVRDKHIYQAN